MRIALLGLGRMGTALGRRLLAGGHDLTAWNRSPDRGGELESAGARLASSPAAAVEGVELAITMLADDEAVRSVALGGEGLIAALAPDAGYVDCSTVSPALGDELARAAGPDRFVAMPIAGAPQAVLGGSAVYLPCAGCTSDRPDQPSDDDRADQGLSLGPTRSGVRADGGSADWLVGAPGFLTRPAALPLRPVAATAFPHKSDTAPRAGRNFYRGTRATPMAMANKEVHPMSVSSVSSAVHPSTVNSPSEAVEGPGPDHDGDKDDLSAAVSAATAKPVSGQPAPGGGVYL